MQNNNTNIAPQPARAPQRSALRKGRVRKSVSWTDGGNTDAVEALPRSNIDPDDDDAWIEKKEALEVEKIKGGRTPLYVWSTYDTEARPINVQKAGKPGETEFEYVEEEEEEEERVVLNGDVNLELRAEFDGDIIASVDSLVADDDDEEFPAILNISSQAINVPLKNKVPATNGFTGGHGSLVRTMVVDRQGHVTRSSESLAENRFPTGDLQPLPGVSAFPLPPLKSTTFHPAVLGTNRRALATLIGSKPSGSSSIQRPTRAPFTVYADNLNAKHGFVGSLPKIAASWGSGASRSSIW